MATPIPIDQQTREAYGVPRWTEKKNGVRNVEVKGRVQGASRQIAGNTVRAAGVGMQAVGKASKAAGRASTRVGASLSSTGVGAVVGVPLMAFGGAATVGGTGMDVAGKRVSQAGRRATRKNSKVLAERNIVNGFSVQARAVMTGMFYVMPILIFGMLEILFLGLTFAVDAVTNTEITNKDGVAETIWKFGVTVVTGAFNGASEVISAVTGGLLDLSAIAGSLHPGNFFAVFYVLTMTFCLMALISVWFVYELSGSKPLSGKGAGSKMSSFLMALCLCCVPIVHLFPWFFVWTATVAWQEK